MLFNVRCTLLKGSDLHNIIFKTSDLHKAIFAVNNMMTIVKRFLVIAAMAVLSIWTVLVFAQPADEDVLWSSPDFTVTVQDVKWYMKSPISADGEYLWEEPHKVRRAIVDLFTLKVLEVEADEAQVMSEEEKQWIADYRTAMAMVSRYLRRQAMEMMSSVDWEQAASEHYLAHRDEFVVPESRMVRTFLLRLEERTESEAVALAADLAPKTLTPDEFKMVVLDNTEDAAAGDGLMPRVTIGQTVQPFEDAVFSMSTIGEISDPIVSEFGVHVVQLLGITPRRQREFEEVEEQVVDKVKQKRWAEFNTYLRAEPERNPPAGAVEMTANIDALLNFADQRNNAAQEAQIRGAKDSPP